MCIQRCHNACFVWESWIIFTLIRTFCFFFYSSVIESLLMFYFCGWGGNCKVVNMNSFFSLIKKCLKMCGVEVYHPDILLEKATLNKIQRIIKDSTHPLFTKITFSTRKSGRFISIKTKTERHRKSFLPRAIRSVTLLSRKNILSAFWILKHLFATAMSVDVESLVCELCYLSNVLF